MRVRNFYPGYFAFVMATGIVSIASYVQGMLPLSLSLFFINQLLNLDEIYFLIHNVELNKSQNFERSSIVNCSKCGELIPHSLTVIRSGMIYCRGCGSGSYYKPGEDKIKVNPLDPL